MTEIDAVVAGEAIKVFDGVRRDGDVTEFWGPVMRFAPRVGRGHKVTVRVRNGTERTFNVADTLRFRCIIVKSGVDFPSFREWNGKTEKQRQALLDKVVAAKRELFWRTLYGGADEELLGVLTGRWVKFKEHHVKFEPAPGWKVSRVKSDGVHGGTILTELPSERWFTPVAALDMGELDGHHAIRLFGRVQFLESPGYLSFRVRKEVEALSEVRGSERRLHSGELGDVKERIGGFMTDFVEATNNLFGAAMKQKVSAKDITSVLQYYANEGLIAERTREHLATTDAESVWELSKALAEKAAHPDFKESVQDHLRHMAGEVMACSPKWAEYMKLVHENDKKPEKPKKATAPAPAEEGKPVVKETL